MARRRGTRSEESCPRIERQRSLRSSAELYVLGLGAGSPRMPAVQGAECVGHLERLRQASAANPANP